LRAIGDTVQVNIAGLNIQQKVLDQLKREIKGQLIIAGFDIVDKVNPKTLNLYVKESLIKSPEIAKITITVTTG